ncbi:uncharacterized protein BJX67DRAFT_382149 [Aspergillus lucknowensis]|uniref:Cellulose-binding Sde182 C-terminal domain-containing protein n=1 Tax=Aspergillus lucknowensis TaxID=176173 RepID=A0ABR4LND9_9EURO
MQWTLHSNFAKANHAPVVVINGHTDGALPLHIEIEAGETIYLDASDSYDPDGDDLSFAWFHYTEPTIAMGVWELHIPKINIINVDEDIEGRKGKITILPSDTCAVDHRTGEALEKGHVYPFVLVVKDTGSPPLRTYNGLLCRRPIGL